MENLKCIKYISHPCEGSDAAQNNLFFKKSEKLVSNKIQKT